MDRDEVAQLLKVRAALTSQPYGEEAIEAWRMVLSELSFDDCRLALLDAARELSKITVAQVVERLPRHTVWSPEPRERLCIRCRLMPAVQLRTRCGLCQQQVDDEVGRGVHSPAMLAAKAAARKPR